MADGVQIDEGEGPKIAARQVPYSGETQQMQVVGIATLKGADDAKVPTDISRDNPFPVESAGIHQILLALANIANILESNTIVDANQRQRITLDAIAGSLTLAAVSTVSTVNTIGSLPNLPSIAGMDREMYINQAEMAYALNILPFLKFG
jgi:hypothetical protein